MFDLINNLEAFLIVVLVVWLLNIKFLDVSELTFSQPWLHAEQLKHDHMFTDFYMQLLVHVRVSTVIDLGAEKLWRNKVLFHGILNNFCVASTCTVHLFIKLFLACHLICNIKLPLFLKNFWKSGRMENNLGHVTMPWWWSLHVSVIPRAGSLGLWPLLYSAMSHWLKLERLNTVLPQALQDGFKYGTNHPRPTP